MKIFFILFVTILGMNQAQAKSQSRDEKNLLKCVRKTIDARRMNANAMTKLYGIIAAYEKSNVKELVQTCESLKNELKDQAKISREEMDKMAEALGPIDDKVIQILKTNIFPHYYCHIGGAQVDVAVVIGGGVGLGIGVCTGDNGKVLAVVVPMAARHLGFGAAATAIYGDFDINTKNNVFGSGEITIGGLFAVKTGEDTHGFGLGLGFMGGVTRGTMLKLVQVGNNFKYPLDNLRALH